MGFFLNLQFFLRICVNIFLLVLVLHIQQPVINSENGLSFLRNNKSTAREQVSRNLTFLSETMFFILGQ